jgi:hypothetical protein
LAKNRYGWEKRAKEMARKQKNEEKMKRRQQNKAETAPAEEPEVVEELSLEETEEAGLSVRQDS